MKRFVFSLVSIAALLYGADNVAPAIIPPGGLAPEEVPMLVCVGWDDNAYHDATEWFGDYIRDKKNKDGSPARTTFLFATGLINENFNSGGNPGLSAEDLRKSWKKLADDGHEIGNHTYNHYHGSGKEKSWWDNELEMCNQSLLSDLNVPQKDITGFRTPYLEYSTGTFQALQELGVEYDCSIEFGYDWVQFKEGYTDPEKGWVPAVVYSGQKASGGFNHYWPYTLDNGPAKGSTLFGGASVGNIPGFWEIPVVAYQNVPSEWDENNPTEINGDWACAGVTTGFDFNMFKAHSDADYILKMLKFNFHQRMKGNRSPFNLNLHTDNYSEFNPDADKEFGEKDHLKRRWVIEQFLDYVLQFEEVRVVPYDVTINYMRNPETHSQYVAPTKGSGGATAVKDTQLKSSSAVSLVRTPDNQLKMDLPAAGNYSIRLTNISGRVIAELHNGSLSAGKHAFSLDGVSTGTGVYLVQVSGATNAVARVMMK